MKHSKEYAGTNHLCNPQRPWVGSVSTDIRATFAKARAAMEQAKQPSNVKRLRK